MAAQSETHPDILTAVQRTYAKAKQIRPENTSRAYIAKQKEFTEWCKRRGGIDDGEIVTSGKLHLFLVEEVIGRERRRGKRHHDQIEVIGKSTIQAYTAAVVDLWTQQKRMKINSHPNPRDDAVQQILQNVSSEQEVTRRKNFDERGIGTLLDGYTTVTEFSAIADYFWQKPRDHGVHLRNLTAFLLSHCTLMRGESVREVLRFKDIVT